ncbi:MAG: phytanoyl-CoA dioxygenase family protein [Proteobacteria bacterium]|nr:phytanoyl-CoA dioxygenase family protein [Pseudomonadota bacterium]
MPIQHLSVSDGPDRIAEILERDGGVIVDRVVPREQLDAVHAEMKPYLEATPTGPDRFTGKNTTRVGGLIARSPAAREVITHPLILGGVKKVLSKATNFQLHLTQIIAIGPGEPAQAVHRDQWAFDFFPFPRGYEVQCNTLWAMTDFTAENGATRLVPGSHRAEDKLEFAEGDTEPAEMEAGSALLYTGSLYHGGGANRSDAVRMGLNITYVVGWLRQEENQYLSVPQEIARDLPDDLLRLMGYAQGAYALGYVDDLRDPLEVLRGGQGHKGFGSLESAQERLARKDA